MKRRIIATLFVGIFIVGLSCSDVFAHSWKWRIYKPDMKWSEVFGESITITERSHGGQIKYVEDPTLEQALQAEGDGNNAQARTAVNALLNSVVSSGGAPSCANIASLQLPYAVITSATVNQASAPNVSPAYPEHCYVLGVINDDIKFEVRLPAQWNGKFYMGGGGGFVGTIQSQGWQDALTRGYATTGTDTGHTAANPSKASLDGSPFFNNPQAVSNFAHRAVHMTAATAKIITRAYYDRGIRYSYFSGCSTGGRQAMMESQRYPHDFDGVIAGAPAYYYRPEFINYIQQAMFPPGRALDNPVLPGSKLAWIQQEVLNHCDALDGVVDGLISDPRKCSFYPPRDLACGVSSSPNCLTADQAEVLNRIYNGMQCAGGDQISGYSPGCEGVSGGWDSWIVYSPAVLGFYGFPNLQYGFQREMLRYLMYGNPNFDFHNFNPILDWHDSDMLASIAAATNTDLSAFKADGGKMIMYNGWCDPILNPLGAIRYYEKASRNPANTRWGGETWNFLRLFLLPGVLHCTGGPGPGNAGVDFLTALENWVEKGIAPEKIIASHITGTTVDRTRPLCPYPKETVYKGTGSINDAANFTCEWPH